MTSDPTPTHGRTVHAERTEDEVVVHMPSPRRLLRAFLPEETVRHLRAARREQLLAVRSLIDAAIERIEKAEHESRERRPRRTEITVE